MEEKLVKDAAVVGHWERKASNFTSPSRVILQKNRVTFPRCCQRYA